MRVRTLIARSLRFHWRSHLGVVLGATVATTVLVGALVVGDSVRWSLHRMALARLGETESAMATPEGFFRAALADEMEATLRPAGIPAAPLLQLRGVAAREDGTARVNGAQVLGVDERFWRMGPAETLLAGDAGNAAVVNRRTARALRVGPGDEILVRVRKPTALPLDAPLSGESGTLALRVTVKAIASDEALGRFSLAANQVPPLNVFVPLKFLQDQLGPVAAGRANVLLLGPLIQKGKAHAARLGKLPKELAIWLRPVNEIFAHEVPPLLADLWQLADAQLELRPAPGDGTTELRSSRVFLDPALTRQGIVAEPGAVGILTYFVNELRVGEKATPYSMVSAVGRLGPEGDTPPTPLAELLPADMADDEVVINAWLADDLGAKTGDTLAMTYFVPGAGGTLETRTSRFRIRRVVPIEGAAADKTLMPDFPGLADVSNCRDWKPGVDIDLGKLRDKDQAYWDAHRGTPKAFVTLAAGRRMWANRFGDLTAVRYPGTGPRRAGALEQEFLKRIDPASLGLYFRPVRFQAEQASGQAMDFGQLFLGLSFFLMAAALVLTGLLFAFGAQQRAEETGTLLAVGFRPKQVRRMMLVEGGALTLVGAAAGTLGGLLYTRAVLWGLATVWKSAVGASDIVFHAEPATLAIGAASGVVVALATVWLMLRRQARAPARELLASGADAELRLTASPRARARLSGALAIASAAGALVILATAGWSGGQVQAGAFFGVGALVLAALLATGNVGLAARARSGATRRLTFANLSTRNVSRRRGRSLATVAVVACGVFLVVAVGANRKGAPPDPGRRSSGTGGFTLFGEASVPIHADLTSPKGRKAYALPADLAGRIREIVPMRVHEGDDASCLNLNRVQQPRLVGVRPEALASRGSFTFAETVAGDADTNPWRLLRQDLGPDVVPAIGDAATIQWSVGKKVGQDVPYTDGRGRTFRLRLVGALADSVMQGSLVIGEDAFIERFPSESGYRMLLVDTAEADAAAVSAVLSERLADEGLAVAGTAERLAEFGAVQNTYLAIFQMLGGLGLLLGSAGLGVVVLRNVLERRGELALMRAVGFRRREVLRMVLWEHWDLLASGLACGALAAFLAVAPVVAATGLPVPYLAMIGLVAGIGASGMLWTWLATRLALRGSPLAALRSE